MISSTFYDLQQVREDLRVFLEDHLGYRTLLSEHPSFPVNPSLDAIENCRERVSRDADVLVLVIGGRYGHVDDRTAKSVTNIEYLAAREKGIPVYAFVSAGILPLLQMYRDNPSANYSSAVDNPLVFDFIARVRDVDKVWTQGFTRAADIIEALRIQFAYEHTRGLLLAATFRESQHDIAWMNGWSAETVRIALERPFAWEWRLFASALRDALASHRKLRARHRSKKAFGLGQDVSDPIAWMGARFSDARRFPSALEDVINSALPEAFGPSGQPGNRDLVLFAAETLGDIYREMLRWSERVRTANIHDCFSLAVALLGRFLDAAIEALEEFSDRLSQDLAEKLPRAQRGEHVELSHTLTVRLAQGTVEAYHSAMQTAAACYAAARLR